jgi:hypothetical protein
VFKQRPFEPIPLKGRRVAFAMKLRGLASSLPPGKERDDLLRRASLAEATSQSEGLEPPK